MAKDVWFSTDPGTDDIQAIIIALTHPKEVNVVGISSLGGNVSIEHTTRNACIACELAGRPDVKVYKGSPCPLGGQELPHDGTHGDDGLGGAVLPAPNMKVQKGDAVDAFIEEAMKHSMRNKLTVACLGPLTDVAKAIQKNPKIIDNIELVVMGGAFNDSGFHSSGRKGNITKTAEFNIYADPKAADIVFSQAKNIAILPWELALYMASDNELYSGLKALKTPVGNAVAGMLSPEGPMAKIEAKVYPDHEGPSLPDQLVGCYLVKPELFDDSINATVLTNKQTGETDQVFSSVRKNIFASLNYGSVGFKNASLINAFNLTKIGFPKEAEKIVKFEQIKQRNDALSGRHIDPKLKRLMTRKIGNCKIIRRGDIKGVHALLLESIKIAGERTSEKNKSLALTKKQKER